MAKICKLPGCNASFVPKREWQKCCSVEHGRKLRYLRRKEKQAKLLIESGYIGPTCCGGIGCNSCEPQGRG